MTTREQRLDDSIYDAWFHARSAYLHGDVRAADHMYRQLRAEHSIELYHQVELKKPTKFVHPLGTVLGRATYASHLVCYQGVSVGSTVDHERPTFLGPCVLFPHSGVIGPVTVGSNVWITAGCIVEGRPGIPYRIPDNSVVFPARDGISTWTSAPTDRSVLDTFFTQRRRTSDTHITGTAASI